MNMIARLCNLCEYPFFTGVILEQRILPSWYFFRGGLNFFFHFSLESGCAKFLNFSNLQLGIMHSSWDKSADLSLIHTGHRTLPIGQSPETWCVWADKEEDHGFHAKKANQHEAPASHWFTQIRERFLYWFIPWNLCLGWCWRIFQANKHEHRHPIGSHK
jgi:hypothetical protein